MRRAAPVAIVACALGACGVENWSFNAVVDSGEGGSVGQAEASNGGCTSDRDCILKSLHCDMSGQCVACITDAQCVQEGLKRCELERCVQCDNDEDCYQDYGCQPTSHECVPSCMTNQACPRSAPQCMQPRGLCVACTEDQDCAGSGGPMQTPMCDLAIGQCALCMYDAQCPLDRPKCDPMIDRCVGCLSSIDCAPELCDPEREMCTGPLDASTHDGPDMTYDSTTGH